MLDKASLMSLRPGGLDLGGLKLAPSIGGPGQAKGAKQDGGISSPFAGLALGAKGNVKSSKGDKGAGKGGKGKKKKLDFDLVGSDGLTSHPLGFGDGGGKSGRKGGRGGGFGGSLAPVALEDQEGRMVGGKVFGMARDGPLVTYDREELLKYAEHFTTLPADLEGTTFEVVLQPGDTEAREAQIAALHSKKSGYEDGSSGAGMGEKTGDQWRQSQPSGAAGAAGGASDQGGSNWSKGKMSKGDRKGADVKSVPSSKAPSGGSRKSQGASEGAAGAQGGAKSSKIVKASDVGLTAWAPARAQSDSERVLRQVRGILNKLTPDNFERLFSQLVESITTAEILSGSISMLFEKAVAEPMFCSLNAELCLRLSKELPEFPPSGGDSKPMTFRRVLLNTCQEEFEGSLMGLSQEANDEKDDADSKAKRRMLGNVKLIGHLFTRRVINQKIVLVCVQQLLSGNIPGQGDTGVHENCIECACEILSLTAKSLGETPKAVPLVESYFAKLDDLANSSSLSSRVRFVIKDVQELKRAKFVPRKEGGNPKTISEIHAEAQAELGIAVMPDSLAKSFAPLSGMITKEDEVQELLPALRGGDEGWDISGKSESNIIDGSKYSAFIGEAPPLPTRTKEEDTKKEEESTSSSKAPPSTPEELEKRTKSTLNEYMISADIGEAMLCIKELNCDEGQSAKVVELVIAQLLDNVKSTEKDLLLQLLVALRTRSAVSAEALIAGLKAHTANLEDLAIDVPLAPQLIGEAIAACIVEGAADLGLLKTILEGCEGCEVKRKFVLVILLKMRQKGIDLKEKLGEFEINLSEVLKADELDPPDLPSVKDFLSSKGLSSLA
ncbi:translation initiation factor eIF-4F [Chloropicon primus]|nr:translation initiation factor eIF-4F [Chloropicon primus]